MSQETWTSVDRYLADLLLPPDPALDAALASSAAAGLPPIQVSALQGRLLHLFARMVGARKVLEIGTLGGYSTICLARALPEGGRVVTLEYAPEHARVARENVARAGLSGVVEIRVGAALDALPRLAAEGAGPFDLVFIDADKEHNADYFDWAMKLTRRGSAIVIDNVVRGGAVVDAASEDPRIVGVRAGNARVAAEPRVSATAMQTVGDKGHDGFLLAIVTADA